MVAAIEWQELYTLERSPFEIFLRGTFVYLGIFFLLRVLLKRQSGNVGLTDMLLIVLIADASQNAMANEYRSVPDGLVLVGTLVFWNYALDWLGYRWPWFRAILESAPLLLIRDGQVLKDNLRRECLTEDDLASQLRQQGHADPSQVREGYIESDGHFSFLPPPSPSATSGRAEPPMTIDPVSLPVRDAGIERWKQFLDATLRLREAAASLQDRLAEHQRATKIVSDAFTANGPSAAR